MTFFQKPDREQIEPSKNLCLGDPDKFKIYLNEFINKNKEGLIKLGRL